MPYTFNGESYRTEDEANQARQKYIDNAAARYADAASVGFDEDRYNRLINSGYGLSQMSDSERNYISKKFLSSADASTAYTKSAVDQYLSSVGLPPASKLDSYRKAYTKYTSGGGIADNYGNVSDTQWKKINELWQKDWEYGLTDADSVRRAAGLAPSSYDDMYEDTLLDQELKSRGLPPSKLLNGSLGESYNKWVSDSNSYAQFNEDVARRYYDHVGVGAKSRYESAASSIAGAISGTPEYTYEQAYADTLADPKWAEFRKEHNFGSMLPIPSIDDDAYVVTEKDDFGNKVNVLDASGNPVRDTVKWQSDIDKALDTNAKITGDEFSLTYEKSREFFDEYGPLVRADIAAENWFSDQGKKTYTQKEYAKVHTDFLAAYTFNDGNGYSFENLFPGVELSDEDKTALRPFIDKANYLLLNSGFEAAQQYIAEESSTDASIQNIRDERIISYMRKMYSDVPGYAAKSDEEVLHQYFKNVGKSYLMSDEDILKLQSGEITLDSYLRSQFTTPEEAWAFAEKMRNEKIVAMNLPTDKDELNKAYENRREAESLVNYAYASHYFDAFGGVGVLTCDDETYNKWVADHPEIDVNDLLFIREKRQEIRDVDQTYYDGKHNYKADDVLALIDERIATPTALYYADIISYTNDYAAKTSDMDYVNKRFNQIAGRYINEMTLEDSSDLWEGYATDDEKRTLVYLADEGLTEEQIGQGIVHYPSVTYARALLQSWDAQRRIDKQAEAGHLYVDTGSTFGNVMLELATGANVSSYILGGIVEGVYNFGADTVKMVAGKELLSSQRLTHFSDVTANNATEISEYTKVGGFVYQMIPSMVQSGASMALAVATHGASEAFTLAAMASQAYSGAVDQALRNGASSGEAYLFGLANGINEALFEKISLDVFVEKADIFTQAMKTASKSTQKSTASAFAKTLLRRMLVQGSVEGSEELFTSLANNFAEALILGYNSSYNKTVEHYVAGGMSQQEAESKASTEVVQAVMMDFVGGLVSGALMSCGGDLIMSHGGRVFMDTTGITRFMNQTVNLSQISVQDALAYANENLETDANGKYTADSATTVFEELVKRGADASVLLRVRTELFNETNSTAEATTPIETMISDQRNVDKSRMLKAAEKYVYNKQANKDAGHEKGKSNVSRAQLQRVVNAYVDELSNRVTRLDVAQIQSAMRATQAEFIENVSTLAGFKESNARIGARALAAYRQSLPEDVQNAIAQNAEKYKNTFNSANLNGAQSGHYAVMAATIEYAVGNGDALTGLNTIFGGSANVAADAVSNACLNSDGATAARFIDRVLSGVGACTEKNGGHLFESARNGVNPTAYVATQMALARSMPENSMSRSTYDHIMKYGASAEALDLLTAANIIETNGVDTEASRKIMGVLMTSDKMHEAADKYTKAVQRYNDKLKIAEAHRQADVQALESENARIAGQEETVRVLEAQLQETQGSDKGVVDALAKARNALAGYVTARDNLVAEQNKRQASTQADVNEAKRAYDSAVREYQMAMFQHSAAYVRRLGAQMESMKGHGSITDTEFKRVTLEAMYGTTDDLNGVEQGIVSAEKTAAVALCRALGVDVECVKFDDAFFAKYNVENPDKTSKGCVIGGKVFLNTDVMTADVGALTDQVLLHEIGHVLEQSADNWKKYSAFAIEYFKKRDGKNRDGVYKVDAWRAQLEQQGMSKEGARRELVAEFSRQVALGDARAINALCKSAPKMSMRIFQWLTDTKARMSNAAAAQSRIVDKAQRAFASGLKEVRNTQSGENANNVSEFAPNRTAMDNALRQLEARVNEQANAPQSQTTAQQTETQEQQTTPAAQTEQTEAAEAQQTVSETTETPVEETVEETTAVENTPTEAEEPAEIEEQQTEESSAEEEPTEDFADIVVDEPTEEPQDNFEDIDGETDSDIWEEYQRRAPVGKNVPIVGETLAEGEYYTDDAGNAYDENGNLVQQAQTQVQPAAEEHAPTSRASEYDRVETEPVPYDDWGEMIDENIYEDIDGDQTLVGYIMDDKRYVSEQYHEPITKKRILQMVDDWRMDDGTYGDDDVTIYIAYDDGKFVDLKDLVTTDKDGNVIGKPYKKSGIIGVYVGTADDEASWGYEINRTNGERVPMSVSIQNENDEPEQLDGNWYVGWKTTGEYYVREKVTSNNIDERGRAHTKREILRRSTVHPYDGAEPFAEEKAEKKAERKAAKSPVQADRVGAPTLTQPVDDSSAPSEAESPVEQPTTTEQPQKQNPRFGLSAAGNAVIDAFVKSRNTSFPKKRTFSQKTAQKTADNVLKAAKKSNVKAIQYGYTDWSERQIVTDAHRVYRFGEHNERLDLPRLPDGVEYPNINKMFDPYKSGKTIELTAPDYQTIKALAKQRGAYSFGEGLPTVQARYLAELMDTYPDVKIYALDDANKAIRPIYAVSRKGEALIVPMRVNADNYDSQISEEVKTLARDYINANGRAIGSEELDAFINQYVTPTAIMKGATAFLGAPNSAQYYTEYDPQTQAVADTIDGMTDVEKRRVGEPKIIETDHGYVVSRVFNMAGFRSGNPMMSMYGSDKQKVIAMIAPVSEFTNGDVGKAVPPQSCSAIVIPNTDTYAEARADARDAGASVYAYDPSDPTNLDRAIDRAANMRHAEYMPSMGYDEWLEQYNAINPQSSRPIPQQTNPTNRVNKVVQTAADSTVTTDETYSQKMPTWLQNGTGTYTPVSNEKTLNRARGVIERAGSLKQAAADLHHDVAEGNGRTTDLLARAELLYAEMQSDNALSLVEQERIFGDLCMISSDAGRALQLVSELKNMTPEGHISYIEQVGRRMSERHQRRTGQQPDLSLTKEEKDAYRRATTNEERDAVDKEVSERWAEETSKLGILDRIRNWRYFAMLGNPRTHFRNMIGNTLMMPITRAKDSINALYQLADVKRGKMSADDRTTTFFTNVDESTKTYVAEQLKKALPIMQNVSTKYIEEATKAANENGEISESKLKEIWTKLREDQPSTHITQGNTGFGRFINALSSFNTNALELEDALYLGMRFKSSMYQQIQARGLDVDSITEEQLDNMVNYAMQEALRATFRDASALADALNKLARTNKATELAMEAIVPFKKTPINIAKRSMEYSPLGLIQGTYKMISNNRAYQQKIDRINASNYTEETKQSELKKAEETYKRQRIEAIDRLAAGTTGSAMYILGIIAASLGWVSIGRKDDEGTQFENALGKANYSLNIGDVSIDLSAFSPAAVPLLMGTATWNAFGGEHEEGEPIVSGIISALAESVDPITEMSMLSGIAEALSGSSYSNYSEGRNTRWFGTIAGNALESYVGQFVPTFVGQTARIADPYARSYSAGNDYWASRALGPEIGGAVKNLQNKVGLGWLSEPKVDLHGEPVKNYTNWGDFILNWANNRVLPATIKFDQKNDVDDELVRLYGVVDSDKLFPTKPSRNIGSYKDPKTGKNVNLKLDNDREYMQYQQEVGQTTYDLLEDLMLSMAYQRMSDADKAAAIEKVIDQAKSATKKRWKAQMMADRS